jgi:hypothetical protein
MDPPQIRHPETRRHFLKTKVDLKVKLNIPPFRPQFPAHLLNKEVESKKLLPNKKLLEFFCDSSSTTCSN